MQRNDLAYLLHIKPYRESSAIVRLLTAEHGLIGAVIKGVYKKDKRAAGLRAALQMGNLLELQFRARDGLKTLYQVDALNVFPVVTTPLFLSCAYVNELLLRLLAEDMPQQAIFSHYQQLYNEIGGLGRADRENARLEALLRCYEFDLLDDLGFAMDFGCDIDDQPVVDVGYYQLIAGVGLRAEATASLRTFSGAVLLRIQQRDFIEPETLSQAKRISRYLLHFYLEGKPLKSRQMYMELLCC